ncbi:MAG: glycosyltransferase family 2 protein [Candidatus Scalindua sp.]|nr:glycosyltransferase family 2 protein [Candidatus Scalindua sp.]
MKYEDGVTVFLQTLNNEKDIEAVLSSISENNPEQIVVADGSSKDRTVEFARNYTADVCVSEPGLARQLKEGLKRVKYKYLLVIENDHRYPKNFIESLCLELKMSDFYGIQGTLECTFKRNYLEKGLACFYEIHQMQKGERDLISGPSIYYSEIFINCINIDEFNGYSSDTRKGEIEKEKKLKVGLGKTIAYQYEPLSFRTFRSKYFNYGRGDYIFYSFHKKNWRLRRKLKSIFHVFNRYVVDYPIKAIRLNKIQYIPYLWLSAVVRYAGWGWEILIHNNR